MAITHCSGEPHLPSSMCCRTTHTSSSRCQALEESSRSVETPNALSEWRSIRWLSQRKYKAASQGNSPVRPLNVWTPSSAPGVTYNKTAWHVPSKRSNAAPTPTLTNLRNQCCAYITTLWKYHGQRGRGTITARPKRGLNRTRGCQFLKFSLIFRTLFFGRLVRQYNCRTNDTTKEAESYVALWNSKVVSITSSIPVSHAILQLAPGKDTLNSPIVCLSHYLYRSALIAAF